MGRSWPVDARGVFDLFRFYRPEVGIHRHAHEMGVGSMDARQIYQAVHGRPPDSMTALGIGSGFNAIEMFVAAISSEEYQRRLGEHLLRAYPEKKRIFFVHIPKTAGTSLGTHLIARYPSINTNLIDPELTRSPEDIYLFLKHIALELATSDTIFISGHTHLGTFQRWDGNGIRFHDDVFTVVREPLAQLISQINYVLTRIFSDEDPVRPDTAGWRREFGVTDVGKSQRPTEVKALASRILHHTGVVVPNIIATFLGGGKFEQSIVQTVAHNLEVVDVEHLGSWLSDKFGITYESRLNQSAKYVNWSDLPASDWDYAQGITQEDQRYYDAVKRAYDRAEGLSVRGARIVG